MRSVHRLVERARVVASDRDSGASEIVRALVPVLEEARAHGADLVRAVVRVACAAQPSMAPVWNACAMALADFGAPGRLARFQQELSHQQRAIVRVAGDAVAELMASRAEPTIVTWSYSGTVAAVIAHVAASRQLTVICAEGRPRLEGRRLASTLAQSGVRVIVTTDAAATSSLERASAVLVGADAVLADRWINKVGTRALAAAAAGIGCPLLVLATRDKALPSVLADRLELPTGDPAEVWDDPPPGIAIASPIFESIPGELATWFATDVGLLTPSDLPTFVRRYEAEARSLLSVL